MSDRRRHEVGSRGSASHAPGKRKVLIVDDHPIVRQGLRLMIDEEPDLKVCGEAQSEREARTAIRDLEAGRRHRRHLARAG